MSETAELVESASPQKRRTQEVFLLALVALAAITANLPASVLQPTGIRAEYIVAVLGLMVVLAMFFYLRFFFFLIYILLAVGANVPAQWAEALGISQAALLVTLAVMVALSLLNYGIKLLPTGLEAPTVEHKQSSEGTKALLAAIERGNTAQVRQILALGIDPNTPGESGIAPLTLAIRHKHADIIVALQAAGATPPQS